ncbi:AMP-binding protein [Dechloromonas sp. ZY10]|uniref:class I adenylate-forming enzyme family protein n=1 Tax=Dechloromonas aquae TaxID=2664436 RepID=UPI003527C210
MEIPEFSLPQPAPLTLADLIRHQAARQPAAPALLLANQGYSYSQLATAIGEQAQRVADCRIYRATGDNITLAWGAYVASWRNLPFFPVDRDISLPPVPSLPSDSALLIATSGSEGEPKQVVLGNQQLLAAASAANQRLPLGPGDLWLACLPLHHIGGQSILWRTATAGAGLLLHPDFSLPEVVAALQQHPVTHLSLVPAMLAKLLAADCRPPASLRHVIIGGAALAPALYHRSCTLGWPLHPSYGMSETAAQVATWTPADGPWQPGLVGRPLAGSEIAIGEDGRIRIRSPQLMLGYLGHCREESGIDAAGWLTSGDLGHLDSAGRLFVTGRADDMLISGGRNIHPQEIEACLTGFPGLVDIAVTGLPDAIWGDRIVALIVGDADEAQLLDHARQRLPGAALPRRLLRVSHLPRNAAGKLNRAAVRALAASQ